MWRACNDYVLSLALKLFMSCWLICLVFTVESYVKSLGQTHLLDLLVQSANEDANMEDVEDLRPSKRKVLYSEVLQ